MEMSGACLRRHHQLQPARSNDPEWGKCLAWRPVWQIGLVIRSASGMEARCDVMLVLLATAEVDMYCPRHLQMLLLPTPVPLPYQTWYTPALFIVWLSCCLPVVRDEGGHGYRHIFRVFSFHTSITIFSINSLQVLLSSAVIHHFPTTLSRSLLT